MHGPRIEVEDDPTPLVLALRAELGERLRDPEFAALTRELDGSAAVRVGTTPEAATFELADPIAIVHGADGARATAVLTTLGRWDGGAIAGEHEHPDLARWLRVLTDPPAHDWRVAAARFWDQLQGRPGAPGALLLVNLDSGERERLGDGADAYEIHAPTELLVALLEGRAQLLDEAAGGAIHIRGSFAQISVLTGAALRVRLGAGGVDE